jgi:hypothetical protein
MSNNTLTPNLILFGQDLGPVGLYVPPRRERKKPTRRKRDDVGVIGYSQEELLPVLMVLQEAKQAGNPNLTIEEVASQVNVLSEEGKNEPFFRKRTSLASIEQLRERVHAHVNRCRGNAGCIGMVEQGGTKYYHILEH